MEKNKETKTLSPKLDVVFQALFGEIGNERITKGFLETILKRKIESIDLSKNPILRREFKDDKLGVLDILAELDGKEKCNIEIQEIVEKGCKKDATILHKICSGHVHLICREK